MPRTVELFAGAGGMALGLLKAGFEHDQLVELYPPPCKILHNNAERDPTLWKRENVRQMDVRDWLREHNHEFGGIDLVAGGPPCQPFSIGGMWAGHADDRNMLPVAVDAIRELSMTFVFENVPGLLHANFLPYYLYIPSDYLARPSIKPPAPRKTGTARPDRIKRAQQHIKSARNQASH